MGMHGTDDGKIHRQHVRRVTRKPIAVDRERGNYEVSNVDDPFAFFASEKQEAFAWIEPLCPFKYRCE